MRWIGLALIAALSLSSCSTPVTNSSGAFLPGEGAQQALQAALIRARPGDTIELAAGRFELDTTLSLDVAGVTIKGQGMDETVLDFSTQVPGAGAEGISITAENAVVTDLAVLNAKSDGIKAEGVNGVTFRRIRIDWDGEPKTSNGAYGLYPVQCENVLIEDSFLRGASDAGIYVGQSKNIIVRRNRVTENVAGIEVENSSFADVYENEAWGNTGGILVFNVPDQPGKDGHDARVFDNLVYDNNLDNFAKFGAIVATVPAGSGILLMAADRVEVFGNEVRGHRTANLGVVSYFVTQRELRDADFDPYAEGVAIWSNELSDGGEAPVGVLADAYREALNGAFPDIVFDGVVNSGLAVDGVLPAELGLYLGDNGEASFAALDFGAILAGAVPEIERSVSAFAQELPSRLDPVVLGATE